MDNNAIIGSVAPTPIKISDSNVNYSKPYHIWVEEDPVLEKGVVGYIYFDEQDINDLARIQAGWVPEGGLDLSIYDMDRDGVVNLKDLVLLAQYVAGWFGDAKDGLFAEKIGDGVSKFSELDILCHRSAYDPAYRIYVCYLPAVGQCLLHLHQYPLRFYGFRYE